MNGPSDDDRDLAAKDRDLAANARDQAADDRDVAGDRRDADAHGRDEASGERDEAAARRDAAAERRDEIAGARERAIDECEAPSSERTEAVRRSQEARVDAAADRERASLDRSAGADERVDAEHDRNTARTDRTYGAVGREHSGSDRGASAIDRYDASLDALTGTYVRGPGLLQLERELVRALRTGEPLTVVFVDVDHLKQVNDAGGHAAGDRLLARVAVALKERLRQYDLVIRYGGDEFICVLPGATTSEAEERLALVNADLSHHGSVSAGVVTAEHDDDLSRLLNRADAALYGLRAQRGTG